MSHLGRESRLRCEHHCFHAGLQSRMDDRCELRAVIDGDVVETSRSFGLRISDRVSPAHEPEHRRHVPLGSKRGSPATPDLPTFSVTSSPAARSRSAALAAVLDSCIDNSGCAFTSLHSASRSGQSLEIPQNRVRAVRFLAAACRVHLRVTRKTVPFASSLTRSAPSRVTATPPGLPHALSLSTTKPVMKSSYSPVGLPSFMRTRITL